MTHRPFTDRCYFTDVCIRDPIHPGPFITRDDETAMLRLVQRVCVTSKEAGLGHLPYVRYIHHVPDINSESPDGLLTRGGRRYIRQLVWGEIYQPIWGRVWVAASWQWVPHKCSPGFRPYQRRPRGSSQICFAGMAAFDRAIQTGAGRDVPMEVIWRLIGLWLKFHPTFQPTLKPWYVAFVYSWCVQNWLC